LKTTLTALLLLTGTAACVSTQPESTIVVESWLHVDPSALNGTIDRARQSGQAWIEQPELYVHQLFALQGIRSFTQEFRYDRSEQPQNIEIQLVRDGFLDDAQRGDIQRIKLRKNVDQSWRVTEVKKAYSCWRSVSVQYSSELCP